MKKLFTCFFLFLLLFSAPACLNMFQNRKAIILVSEPEMHKMGLKSFNEIKKKEKRLKNPAVKAMLVRIGQRIAKASGKNYKWEFEVFDAPKTANAFCLPGGKIGFYTGIFPVAKGEAGIAAIMGHEVAHAILRHGAERVSQNMVINAGTTLAGLLLKDNKNKGIYLSALGLGTKFGVLLPYSRKHETESDLLGTELMAKAGYNPNEAANMWERMAKLGDSSIELLSTHPDPLNRAKKLRKNMSRYMKLYQASQKQPNNRIPKY